ncbi:Stealth CR1 domain-containing protein [uncultured Proteiniphilum sp.]|uniref:Stealth CR1 domain-containing protein n=1 Tax=uncultured Proteiniphilum sp. TaxID=497637 RepID=UPI00262C07A9|nr:Stealth CR1 domain-containing protein [uncultured Proteiniphilum sp.]
MPQFDIDLVYLWVDGNDAEWVARKKRFLGENVALNTEATTKARNANNDELKYSLRSAEKYAPWIHNIFIVTDGQKPDWLDLQNGKIKIVDIRELIPPEALPCYNSVIIEHFLYKIPDLSEHFLYANDDMFFNVKVTPGFFFTSEGFPVVRLQRTFGGKWINKGKKVFNIHTNIYRKTIDRAASLIEKKFGRYYSGTPHHNIDSYLKSDYRLVSEKIFRHEIHSTITHHLRSEDDIQRIIYLYYALAVRRGELCYVGRRESCRIRLQKPDYMYFINRYQPILFCLNDSHHATDADRNRVRPFLKTLFPEKSSFEM